MALLAYNKELNNWFNSQLNDLTSSTMRIEDKYEELADLRAEYKRKYLELWQEEFVDEFYTNWEYGDDDQDTPTPWGAPWYYNGNFSTYDDVCGLDPEKEANAYYAECEPELKRLWEENKYLVEEDDENDD